MAHGSSNHDKNFVLLHNSKKAEVKHVNPRLLLLHPQEIHFCFPYPADPQILLLGTRVVAASVLDYGQHQSIYSSIPANSIPHASCQCERHPCNGYMVFRISYIQHSLLAFYFTSLNWQERTVTIGGFWFWRPLVFRLAYTPISRRPKRSAYVLQFAITHRDTCSTACCRQSTHLPGYERRTRVRPARRQPPE